MTERSSLSITVPFPPRCLWPNSRGQHRFKTDVRRAFKDECFVAAHAAKAGRGPFPWPAAIMGARFYQPDARSRDRDNANGSLKYAIDAIVNAGLLENDRDVSTLMPIMDIDKGNSRAVLTFVRVESPDLLDPIAAAVLEGIRTGEIGGAA
jgi:hypothetical protein